MISIWEQESFLDYDVIIAGAGITGLSTAISLMERKPNLRLLILEKGTLPTGASTKNAGFACFGSLTELLHDMKILGKEGMLTLVERRWKGLQKTRNRLGDKAIELQQKGGYELLDEANSHLVSEIPALNELLRPLFGQEVFRSENGRIGPFGFKGVSQLVYNPLEGQLHTGKLIKSLWHKATQLGVDVLTGTEVTGFEEVGDFQIVKTPTLNFRAKAIAICTNAFSKTLVPPLDVTPGRGIVMLLNPAKTLPFEGTFHYQEGFYYFRDFHGKLIFGGGRNLDPEGERTTEFGFNPHIEAELHRLLRQVILPGMTYETEMKWSGIMAFGPTKEPIIRQTGTRLFAGVRLGGMGVAIGSMVGEALAELISESIF